MGKERERVEVDLLEGAKGELFRLVNHHPKDEFQGRRFSLVDEDG